MSAARLEALLARVYTDDAARARFLADPAGEAGRAGLGPEEISTVVADLDRPGLALAAASFARKRAARASRQGSMAALFHRIFRR